MAVSVAAGPAVVLQTDSLQRQVTRAWVWLQPGQMIVLETELPELSQSGEQVRGKRGQEIVIQSEHMQLLQPQQVVTLDTPEQVMTEIELS